MNTFVRAVAFTSFAAVAAAQTGTPAIQPFDDFMENLLTKHKIPGGSIAVVRNGKLVMAPGYVLAGSLEQHPGATGFAVPDCEPLQVHHRCDDHAPGGARQIVGRSARLRAVTGSPGKCFLGWLW